MKIKTVSAEDEANGDADEDEGRKRLSLPSLSLAGCLHLYSEAIEYSFYIENRASPIFQPLSINTPLYEGSFPSLTSYQCACLFCTTNHIVCRGQWKRKTWGPLFRKLAYFSDSRALNQEAGRRMLPSTGAAPLCRSATSRN